jgi:O-succinylbenzoate synthase
VPIALDEELIGVSSAARLSLLTRLKPKSIILKPSLMGGLQSTADWIQLASQLGISWWITSALESNIGLNAIAQFTAQYPVSIPQGLGTGSLYTNNIISPLQVAAGNLNYNLLTDWNLELLFPLEGAEKPLFIS